MPYTYYISTLILTVIGFVFWTYPPKKINGQDALITRVSEIGIWDTALIRFVTYKSFKGNSILPMKQRFKFVRMECVSAHLNRKRLSPGSRTGQEIKHFLFSHGERREIFQTTKYTKNTKEWGTGNGVLINEGGLSSFIASFMALPARSLCFHIKVKAFSFFRINFPPIFQANITTENFFLSALSTLFRSDFLKACCHIFSP